MKISKLAIIIISLLLILASLPILGACAKQTPTTPQQPTTPSQPAQKPPEQAPQTFKIGQVVSITGPMSISFKGIYDAAKPTADLLNSMGGITVAGKKYNIEIVSTDDQSSPQGAISAYNQLTQQGIKFMNAPQFTPANIALSSVAEKEKVIRSVGMIVDPSQFGPDFKYDFTFCTLYQIPPAYSYLVKNYPNVKTVAILRVDDPGGVIPEEISKKEAASRGLKVVATENYPVTTEDFLPIVTKIMQKNPDAIDLVITITPWAKGIITAARQLGFKGPIFLGCPLGDNHDLINMLDPKYATDIFSGTPDLIADNMSQIIKDFRPLMEKAQGRQIYLDNIIPLLAIYPMLQAIEAAQSFDTTEVANTWINMKSIDTAFGPGHMGGMEICGSNNFSLPDKFPGSRILNGQVESYYLDAVPFAK
jgi:ABC-type branched-subunit amino acid transport system substrate-binding protein